VRGPRATVIEAGLLIALTWGGVLIWIDRLWRDWGLTGVSLGLAVLVSVYVLIALVNWPLSLYRVFGIEARFGFNRMTWQLYLADLLKTTAVSAVLGLPLLAAVLWLMQGSREYWWLVAWLVWATFSLFLVWAYPALIAPLFNRFRPIDDATLKQRIESLLERCGFASRGVFVMDGSRRSTHGNAYFTGLGTNKRIVLFDTLLERLTVPEVEAVLAHELGHFRLHHIRRRVLLTLALGLAGLYLLGWLAEQSWFYLAFGGATPSPHVALALFSLWLPVLLFWIGPLSSAWSRKHEFEADRFATDHSDARDLASALVKLYRDNATTLSPDRLYSAFFDTHPPAPVRIARLRATRA
jgi:STE24 endopeptidase